MAPRLRRMDPYHPRKRRAKGIATEQPAPKDLKHPPHANGMSAQKQVLKDLKHKISADVGTLIVFIEEGNTAKIEVAQQKAKNDFLKHSTEMQKIAEKMGDRYVRAVREYLESVDTIVHTSAAWIDEEKIRHCHTMTENLEKAISA
jgi:hypothetical protein